jgi:protein-S-isoprenylcysteine O-methyltransferase Ste14
VNDLAKRALFGLITLQLTLALLLFLPAWSLHFWEAWIYWSLFLIFTLAITLYLLKYDPGLLGRRLQAGPGAETEKSQKVIQAAAGVLSCALAIVPGLDHRFHWSAVPVPVVLIADALVGCGFLICFLVFRENSYASSVVQVSADQAVISTGPYRLVRHPMYAGGMVMMLATPFALGSLWALLPAVPVCAVVVVRLLEEERYLSANLLGYKEYCQTVRHRLIPLIW